MKSRDLFCVYERCKLLSIWILLLFGVVIVSCNKPQSSAVRDNPNSQNITASTTTLTKSKYSDKIIENGNFLFVSAFDIDPGAYANKEMYVTILKDATKVTSITYNEDRRSFAFELQNENKDAVKESLTSIINKNITPTVKIDEKGQELSAINGYPLAIERLSVTKIEYAELIKYFKEDEMSAFLLIETDDELMEKVITAYKKRKKEK